MSTQFVSSSSQAPGHDRSEPLIALSLREPVHSRFVQRQRFLEARSVHVHAAKAAHFGSEHAKETRHWVHLLIMLLPILVISCAEVEPLPGCPVGEDQNVEGFCESLCANASCDDENECTTGSCEPLDGLCNYVNVANGTACDFGGVPGVCADGTCEDAMLCAGVDCDDDNDCTLESCESLDGLCSYVNVTDGTACDFGGLPGVCADGTCEDAMLCAGVDCDDDNDCTRNACDPLTGECAFANLTPGTLCSSSDGYLGTCDDEGTCLERFCDFDVQCNDGNECTTDACFAFANRCENAPRTGSCDGGNGFCLNGRCIPSTIIDPPPITF